MKTILNITLSLMFLAFCSLHSSANEYKKEFSKNYPIDPFAELLIATSFSNVHISNWDKNEIEVAIVVTVNANSEEKANKIFDKIKVDLIGNKSKVEIRTEINNMDSKSGNYNISINIKAPENINLNAHNSFGDIAAGVVLGSTKIDCDYGKFSADHLASAENNIHANFGNIVIKKINGAELNCSFGNMEISEITGNGNLNSSYGELNIALVSSKVTDLSINSEFGNASVNFAAECNLSVKATVSMGSISTSGRIEVISDSEQYGSASFQGKIGQGAGKFNCQSNFGNLSISTR